MTDKRVMLVDPQRAGAIKMHWSATYGGLTGVDPAGAAVLLHTHTPRNGAKTLAIPCNSPAEAARVIRLLQSHMVPGPASSMEGKGSKQ